MKTAKKLAAVLIAVVILCSMCLLTASAEGSVVYGAATVNADVLNLREAGGKDCRVIATIPDDAVIVIDEKTSKEWFKVTYDGTTGYVSTDYLIEICTAEDFKAIGKVTGDWVNVRALPGPTGAILKTLEGGTRIDIIGVNNGWYILDVDGTRGYIRSDFVKLVSEKDADKPLLGEGFKPLDPDAELAQQIVDFALQYVGYPYVYGASGPYSFDCSGFVMYVYGQFGYELYHGATGLYNRYGTYVDRADLQPGDLVFFYGFYDGDGDFCVNHVGIYIADGQFVHASNSSTGVIVSDMNSVYGSWYNDEYVGAKRIL
ncbi:MAG: C40 family peptidase [Oscillospiraceae bacterium]|nr:C40 family peptidase [Oscillospiraceae bacterium]